LLKLDHERARLMPESKKQTAQEAAANALIAITERMEESGL